MEDCKISFYEDYVEALMEFCEKRSNAPKSEEEQAIEQSEDEQVREYEEVRTEDGKLAFIHLCNDSICVYQLHKVLDEIDSLKCLLDKQVITDTDFYVKCHNIMKCYDLPF